MSCSLATAEGSMAILSSTRPMLLNNNACLSFVRVYLRKKENDIRVAIERNKQVVMKQEQKLLKKRGFMYFSLFNSLPKKSKEHFYQRKLAVNPMILLLFTGMCLKSWQNYTKWFKDLEKDDYQLKRHMNSDEKYDYR